MDVFDNFCYDMQEATVKSLRKYGVGSCGPRGFYGTVGQCELIFATILLVITGCLFITGS